MHAVHSGSNRLIRLHSRARGIGVGVVGACAGVGCARARVGCTRALTGVGCTCVGVDSASVGFGCTGGQHRSVAMAETLAKALADGGWQVSIRHRELERHAPASPPPRPVPETVAMKGGDKL